MQRKRTQYSHYSVRRQPTPRSKGSPLLFLAGGLVVIAVAVSLLLGLPSLGMVVSSFNSDSPGNDTPDRSGNVTQVSLPKDNEGEAWSLTLVNAWNPAPQGIEVRLAEVAEGHLVDERIVLACKDMLRAAQDDGVHLFVVSAYRTVEEQQQLWDDKVASNRADELSFEDAERDASRWVARPGASEHHLGLAVDINADTSTTSDEDAYEWLAQNASEFGFIQRYQSEKTAITGIAFEPWHYRYVGVEAAREISNRGICLEEYLDKIH